MAHILIGEPSSDVRELIAHVARRRGHTTVSYDSASPGELLTAAAFVLEPLDEHALACALDLRRRRPELGILCVSIAPPADESRALLPVATIAKPFSVLELERALEAAVTQACRAPLGCSA